MATVIRGSDNFDTSDNATQTELDALSTGKVLQVVNDSTSTETSTTSTSLVDTTLSATITPSNTNNKILIFASLNAFKSSGNLDTGVQFALARNGSSIIGTYFVAYGLWNYIDSRARGGYSVNYLDSPNSTSALTYKIKVATMISGIGAGLNHDASTSTITLMEIAG